MEDTTAGKIKVMQAYLEGRTISWPINVYCDERVTAQIEEDGELCWNWEDRDYRIDKQTGSNK